MFKRVILVLNVVFAWQLCAVHGEGDLVFLIDDTGSMMDDIDQVKTQIDKLFDAAYNSNASQVEDFLIVTFNDPSIQYRVKTRDREEFRKALNNITVDGGGDCPEMAMAGLELALQDSRKKSLIYVFTDASAKDFERMEAVKTLAKEQKSKLMFMLTGTCYGEDDNRTYLDLAEATGGQVFSLFKKEVGQMLEYARETIAGGYRQSIALAAAAIPESLSGDLKFTADNSHTTAFKIEETSKEVLVSVSGDNPLVYLIGPDGSSPKTEDVVSTSGSKVFKILEAKPGTYTITVKSSTSSSVVVNEKVVS